MKLSCNVTLALYAFDLLELDGEDLRRAAFETRKATLASLLRSCLPGLRLNEHLTHPSDAVFRHACKVGLEGIVSKRLGSRYTSPGRTRQAGSAASAASRAAVVVAGRSGDHPSGSRLASPRPGKDLDLRPGPTTAVAWYRRVKPLFE